MSAKRNLLLGNLALQNNCINRAQLLAAFNAWLEDKSKSLGALLIEQRSLSPEHHALLDALVDAHLQQHGDDADRSLAALSSASSAHYHLAKIEDPDVQASLAALAVGHAALPVQSHDADPCHRQHGRWRTLRAWRSAQMGRSWRWRASLGCNGGMYRRAGLSWNSRGWPVRASQSLTVLSVFAEASRGGSTARSAALCSSPRAIASSTPPARCWPGR